MSQKCSMELLVVEQWTERNVLSTFILLFIIYNFCVFFFLFDRTDKIAAIDNPQFPIIYININVMWESVEIIFKSGYKFLLD